MSHSTFKKLMTRKWTLRNCRYEGWGSRRDCGKAVIRQNKRAARRRLNRMEDAV